MKFPKLEGSQHISSYCVACLWPSLLQSFIQTSDPSGTIYIGEESTTLSRRDNNCICSYIHCKNVLVSTVARMQVMAIHVVINYCMITYLYQL